MRQPRAGLFAAAALLVVMIAILVAEIWLFATGQADLGLLIVPGILAIVLAALVWWQNGKAPLNQFVIGVFLLIAWTVILASYVLEDGGLDWAQVIELGLGYFVAAGVMIMGWRKQHPA